jgi:hypothetical protein
MKSITLQALEELPSTQRQHQMAKGAFSVMLFELFGNKDLTDTFIRYPLCSAVQPASVLKAFAEAWKQCKDTVECKRAIEQSKPNEGRRHSKQIYLLVRRSENARWVTTPSEGRASTFCMLAAFRIDVTQMLACAYFPAVLNNLCPNLLRNFFFPCSVEQTVPKRA